MDDVTFESGTGLSDCDTDEITGFLSAFNKITGAHIGIHDPLYAVAYASGGRVSIHLAGVFQPDTSIPLFPVHVKTWEPV